VIFRRKLPENASNAPEALEKNQNMMYLYPEHVFCFFPESLWIGNQRVGYGLMKMSAQAADR
jgi:hypothetical protein